MLDRLFNDHREIQLDEKRTQLSDEIKRRIRAFSKFEPQRLEEPLFQIARDIDMFVHVFELYLKTAYAAYVSQVPLIERELCEIISLHKLQEQFLRATTNMENLALNVLGVMIRHRLINLFLDMDPRDATYIFNLGKDLGVRTQMWEAAVTNAASRARTIANFLSVSNCYVFLPTVEENLKLHVDIIVITDERDSWCVIVKPGTTEGKFYVECVSSRPNSSEQDYGATARREIYGGTQQMNAAFDGDFLPCRVIVGKTNGDPIDLTSYPEDCRDLKAFMERNHARPAWPKRAIAA